MVSRVRVSLEWEEEEMETWQSSYAPYGEYSHLFLIRRLGPNIYCLPPPPPKKKKEKYQKYQAYTQNNWMLATLQNIPMLYLARNKKS